MAIYFDQLIYLKAPIDRHFVAEHFGILFAFFWTYGSKVIEFLSSFEFSVICFNSRS